MNMVFYLSLTRSTDQSNSEILFTVKLIELHRAMDSERASLDSICYVV